MVISNSIKYFDENGNETNFESCKYASVKLLGKHAKLLNAHMLISREDVTNSLDFLWYLNKSGYPATYKSKDGKINFKIGCPIHRLIKMNQATGMVVDHINRNKLDNRRENLRVCTAKENSYNKSKIVPGKYKGVKKCNKTEWSAVITKDGVKHEMKGLPDEITAAKMYDMMAEELFGEFCAKNNPIEKSK